MTPGASSRRFPRLTQGSNRILGVLVLAALVGLGAWNLTPSVDNVQSRVAARAQTLGVGLLQPGEVPPLLADAVVSIEDERFFQHHGLDAIGLGRATLDDIR